MNQEQQETYDPKNFSEEFKEALQEAFEKLPAPEDITADFALVFDNLKSFNKDEIIYLSRIPSGFQIVASTLESVPKELVNLIYLETFSLKEELPPTLVNLYGVILADSPIKSIPESLLKLKIIDCTNLKNVPKAFQKLKELGTAATTVDMLDFPLLEKVFDYKKDEYVSVTKEMKEKYLYKNGTLVLKEEDSVLDGWSSSTQDEKPQTIKTIVDEDVLDGKYIKEAPEKKHEDVNVFTSWVYYVVNKTDKPIGQIYSKQNGWEELYPSNLYQKLGKERANRVFPGFDRLYKK